MSHQWLPYNRGRFSDRGPGLVQSDKKGRSHEHPYRLREAKTEYIAEVVEQTCGMEPEAAPAGVARAK